MKKFITKVVLPIAFGFLTTVAMATPAIHSFGKSNDYIHRTHFHTAGDPLHVGTTLYFGIKVDNICKKLTKIAHIERDLGDGDSIASASEDFYNQKLIKDASCAVEKFVLLNGNSFAINYNLINDGTTITAADPTDSDIIFPTFKK